MKTLHEAREEFNDTMNSYTMIVIESSLRMNKDFFMMNGLRPPEEKVSYIPPSWVGPTYSKDLLESPSFGFQGTRIEKIPQIRPSGKYLIYDDYVESGGTMELALIRCLQRGVKLENLWGFSLHGTEEIGFMNGKILDRAIEWHNYSLRQTSHIRDSLEELGFKFPHFPNKNL